MIRLRTLGTLELTGPDAAGLKALVSQPKRVVLLAYLVVARPRGVHRRDSLLALLWPESDQTHARHALSQMVYQLRRTLGPDVMLSRGDEALGIDGAKLWCDVTAFEDALAGQRLEDALELYRGEFLAGFFVSDVAPELDEWIAAERTRLRTAAAGAAWTLATREERAGNGAGAASWARRATALSPVDEHAVRQLVGLLGRLGDRTGALRAYDQFARRLHQEFEIRPSAELRTLAEEMRRTPASVPKRSATAAASSSIAEPVAPPSPGPGRRWLTVGAAVTVFAVIGALLIQSRAAGRDPPILAVGAITDFTHGDSAAPAPVVVDLLATSLARLPSVQVLATARLYEVQSQLQATRSAASLYDAARAAGARQLIQGTLHPNPSGGVRLDLERIDIKSGAVRSGYRAEGRDLFAAVDVATTAIARDLGAPVPDEPVANVTTRSLMAYRFYEEGLRAFYQNDITAAVRLFRSALDEDSSFAMAAYWEWRSSGSVPGSPLLERAARLADHTTDRERLLIRETLAETRLEPVALALAETLAFRYPTDPDAQLVLGRARSWQGNFLGAVDPLRRVLTLDSLGFSGREAQCRACDAYLLLGLVYGLSDSLPAAERTAREWVRRQPESPRPWGFLAAILETVTQHDAALAAYHVADSLTPGGLPQDWLRARLAIRRGDFADADQRLRRLIAERSWGDAEWFLVISLRNQGRLREAAAIAIARQPPLRPVLLFEQGRFREAAADFEASAHAPLARSPVLTGHVAKNLAFNLTHAATCFAAAGDTGRLAGLSDSIESAGRSSLSGRETLLAHYVRGLLLTARGQSALAAEEYRKAVWSWTEGYTRVNYALAQALLQTGRPREAIAALQPAFRGSLEAANLYITRTGLHELLAQAFEAAGQRDSATVHWHAVESAWRSADPQFRARWEVARRHLKGTGPTR